MISSFALFSKSASFHETVRELIILPSCRWLRQISATVTANCDLESNEYLQRKTSYLQDEEIYVNLMLDEIHVKPQLSFKNSSLTGCDDDNNLATSIHCFMISSLRSKYKEVEKLVPAKTMDAEKLLTFLKSVLRSLVQAGYKVVSVITDGNRINKRLFCLLCGCDKVSDLPPYIKNPFDNTQKLFLLFDAVHILKGLRNNWINLKNYKKTFSFPLLTPLGPDENKLLRASFAELEQIYINVMECILKKAPALSWKALHPHALERQSVSLALKVFTQTNVAALKHFGPADATMENWEGTSTFIAMVCKWWDIINVHHPYKGRNTNNPDAYPIYQQAHA